MCGIDCFILSGSCCSGADGRITLDYELCRLGSASASSILYVDKTRAATSGIPRFTEGLVNFELKTLK